MAEEVLKENKTVEKECGVCHEPYVHREALRDLALKAGILKPFPCPECAEGGRAQIEARGTKRLWIISSSMPEASWTPRCPRSVLFQV